MGISYFSFVYKPKNIIDKNIEEQRSILGPLLFNIFINDIFWFVDKAEIANYADDNITYGVENCIMTLLKVLEEDTLSVLNWFRFNEMVPNQGKCHLMIADIDHKHYEQATQF